MNINDYELTEAGAEALGYDIFTRIKEQGGPSMRSVGGCAYRGAQDVIAAERSSHEDEDDDDDPDGNGPPVDADPNKED